jgi:arabinogalactan endo-1,4-beta-galactosidase
VADVLEDVNLLSDVGSPIALPSTVNAIMTDGSRSAIPVEWNVTDAELDTMAKGGAAKYTVTGTAGGMQATAYITVMEFNYLENYSFETGDLSGWTATNIGGTEQLYVEDKITDSLTGSWHMHFWSPGANTVEFTLEQTAAELAAGTYKFTISIMGGDSGESEIYAYAKINGEIVGRGDMKITSYGNWDTVTVYGIEYAEGDILTVGIYVKCAGSGNGAWGKIDDALLNSDR